MKTINYILVTAIVLSFSSCMQQPKEKEITETTSQQAYEYMTTARLTVLRCYFPEYHCYSDWDDNLC